jgi:hypothetical protein
MVRGEYAYPPARGAKQVKPPYEYVMGIYLELLFGGCQRLARQEGFRDISKHVEWTVLSDTSARSPATNEHAPKD